MKESTFKRFAEGPSCTEKVLASALLADSSLFHGTSRGPESQAHETPNWMHIGIWSLFFLNVHNVKFAVVTIF